MAIFEPNCTRPSDHASFVSGPNVRGTLDILWSCLSILLLSTWSVLRPNVPLQIESQTTLQKVLRWCYFTWLKVKLVVLSWLFPELLLGLALAAYVSARKNKRAGLGSSKDEDWSTKRAYFADMGGFVVCFDGLDSSCYDGVEQGLSVDADAETFSSFQRQLFIVPDLLREKMRSRSIPLDEDFSLAVFAARWSTAPWRSGKVEWQFDQRNAAIIGQALFQASGHLGIDGRMSDYFATVCLQGKSWYLSATQLRCCLKIGLIKEIPSDSDRELSDKDQGDGFVTILAFFQILWLAIQLLNRKILDVPSTQLEVMTLANAACSFMTYGLNFNKPKDAKRPIYIAAERYASPVEVLELARQRPLRIVNPTWVTPLITDLRRMPFWDKTPWFANDSYTPHEAHWLFLGSTVGSITLGSIHCIAWNSRFPTPVECFLWRLALVATGVLPIILIGSHYVQRALDHRLRRHRLLLFANTVIFAYSIVLFLAYLLARLYVIVESVRSLAYQPAGAFVSTWTMTIPHFG